MHTSGPLCSATSFIKRNTLLDKNGRHARILTIAVTGSFEPAGLMSRCGRVIVWLALSTLLCWPFALARADDHRKFDNATAVGENVELASRSSLASYHGRWLLIDFLASWCEACIRDLPREIADLGVISDNARIVAIDEREPRATIQRLIRSRHIPFPVMRDGAIVALANRGSISDRRAYLLYGTPGAFGAVAQLFDVSYLPTHILLNSRGNEVARWSSSPPAHDEMFEELERFGLLRPLAIRH